MPPRTVFLPYQPKTILNKGKRVDHWFWTRYSAYPYLGCQHGCEFCYCREQKYFPHKELQAPGEGQGIPVYDAQADPFAHRIKVKENAPLLLRQALSKVPVDLVFTGDYQPAERKFQLSRQMLEVCLELGFPVFVLTRSPLILRDLDLLQAINQKAPSVVAFSIIAAPDSPAYTTVRGFERLAPSSQKRFDAMRQVAQVGILTGTIAMPLLPGLCDTDENLHGLARWTAEYGGRFILPSSLTLSDQQRGFFLQALQSRCPELLPLYQRLYPAGHSYAPVLPGKREADNLSRPWNQTAQRVRQFCHESGLSDRIPRPVIPDEKRELNKRVVEKLAAELYTLEITGAPQARIWAYRKAAWAIEDLEQDIRLFYHSLGRKGLESLPGVGLGMAGQIEELLTLRSDPTRIVTLGVHTPQG